MLRDYTHIYYWFAQHIWKIQKNQWKKINHPQCQNGCMYNMGVFTSGNNMVGPVWGCGGASRCSRAQRSPQWCLTEALPANRGERRRPRVEGSWVLPNLAHEHVWVRVKSSCQVWAISVTFHSQGLSLQCHHHYMTLSPATQTVAADPCFKFQPKSITYMKDYFCFAHILKHSVSHLKGDCIR